MVHIIVISLLAFLATPCLSQMKECMERPVSEGMLLENFLVSGILSADFTSKKREHSLPANNGNGLTQWEVKISEILSKRKPRNENNRLPDQKNFEKWYGTPRTTDEIFSSPGFRLEVCSLN